MGKWRTWEECSSVVDSIPGSFPIHFINCFGCRMTANMKSFFNLLYAHTLGSISVFTGTDNLCGALEILPEQRPTSLKVMSTPEFYKYKGGKIIFRLSYLHNEMVPNLQSPQDEPQEARPLCVLILFGDSQTGFQQFGSSINNSHWQGALRRAEGWEAAPLRSAHGCLPSLGKQVFYWSAYLP